jgi:hypothetical protein
MEDRLEPVAVEVADERCVVPGAVLRAEPGRSFVDGSHAKRSRVEGIDGSAVRRREREVAPLARRARPVPHGENGERLVLRAGRTVTHGALRREEAHVTERLEETPSER